MEQRHYLGYPELTRTADQLSKKFNDLAKRNIHTGDPAIPEEVREAKRMRGLIYQKADGGNRSINQTALVLVCS